MSIVPAVTSPTATPSSQARLAWLDALRGIGATAVVAEHLLPWVVPWLRPYWFNVGVYGILVFFLVSGYIIPASLERHGDVRAFWISRAFRLYPLYLVVIGVVLAMTWRIPLREAVPRDPATVAAHATMLLDVVGVGGVADTMWTLSYEMVFYLLVTALFVTGTHRRSGVPAVLFGVAAVATALLIPAATLTGSLIAWISAGVLAAGLACVVSGRFRRVGACALGVMSLALLFLGSRVPWLGVVIVAVMFAGTAIHRWERGTGPFWPVALTLALVAVAPLTAVQGGWWWIEPDVWLTTVALALATFAGAMALRHRRVPRFLTWLGLISYSLYLLHHPLLKFLVSLTGDLRWSPRHVQLLMAALFLAVILAAAWVTYRLVEKPMQHLGHRLSRPDPTRP
ncbi:acyltransferase family protein [Sphaerisporangium perillae]|uniref:acyltransferase family protein n=1 Tax=Sphaerisporangium perillae TaxID=2935860 RepID=UPI00200FEB71|nr:acyltransferase [Sphaerisporangium perillae]